MSVKYTLFGLHAILYTRVHLYTTINSTIVKNKNVIPGSAISVPVTLVDLHAELYNQFIYTHYQIYISQTQKCHTVIRYTV